MSVENTAPVFSNVTDSKFSVSDRAMMIAEKAGDLVILQFLVEKCFLKCHFGLPHLAQKRSASQCLRVKDKVIIPQPRNYFA